MMRRLIGFLVALPVGIALIVLAVANRAPVTLSLDPLARAASPYTVTVPLFVALFLALMLGVVLGGMASWFAQGRHRRAERMFKREAQSLKAETDRLKAQQAAASGLPAALTR
jgi:uncharacterized integral membrane protein